MYASCDIVMQRMLYAHGWARRDAAAAGGAVRRFASVGARYK